MPILNYTTKISAQRTAGEIQARLAKAKATAVLIEYGPQGEIAAMSFSIPTQHGVVSFRLPANIEGVYRSLCKATSVPKSKKTREQAANVAWRILQDWVAAQLAIVEAELADMVEVFLPYAKTPAGKTIYHALNDTQLRMLALSGPTTSKD